jgi:hypothetical protein
MLATLLSPGLPNVHVVEAGLGQLDSWRIRVERDHAPVIARIVRGRRARTSAAFFDEAAAALQLPAYCGATWEAFADCAGDVGAPGAPRLLIVRLALELFADEPRALPILISVAAQLHADRPFHLVLQDTPGGIPDLEDRLRDAQIEFDHVALD